MFIFGISAPIKNMIAYTHMMEFLPGRVTEVSGFLFFTDGMSLVLSPLLLQFITNNTFVFIWVGLVLNLLAIGGFMAVRVPESVIFLLENHKFQLAKQEIAYIMNFNKTGETDRIEIEEMLDRYVMK
jgi:hypothetical protein